MYYPYYQDPMTGVPAGHFSAPLSRANISNPITPYGIPYNSPHQSPYPPVVPGPQRQPHRFRNALQKGLLLGGALYAASQLGKGGDDDDNGGDGSREPFIPKSPKTPPSDKFANQPQINDGGYPGDIGHKKPAANYLTTDPEEVGGLRSQVSKNFLSDFRKNIASEYTFDSVPPVESERVGVSPEQEARSRTWTSLDNDRFFDHPDVDDHAGSDETPNVDAGQQHLDNYVARLVDAGVEHLENTTRYTAPASSSMMRGVEISPEFEVEVTTFPGKRQQKRAEAAQKAGIANMTDKYYYDQLQLRETDSREVQQEKVRKQVELMDAMRAGSEGSVSMGNRYNELLKKPYGGHVKGRYAEEGMVDAVYPQSPYPRDEF